MRGANNRIMFSFGFEKELLEEMKLNSNAYVICRSMIQWVVQESNSVVLALKHTILCLGFTIAASNSALRVWDKNQRLHHRTYEKTLRCVSYRAIKSS